MNKRSTKFEGSALVGVLSAAGIFAIISVAMATLIGDIWKAQNASKSLTEANNFHEELRVHLGNKQACLNTFGTVSRDYRTPHPKTFAITQVKNSELASPTDKYSLGTAYGSGSFDINAISIQYPNPQNTPVDMKEALALVTYRMRGQTIGPSTLKPREIVLGVDVNAGGTLIECRPKARMSDGIWMRHASNPTRIHFSEGNVGIGATDPQFLLDLETGQNSTSWLGVKSSPLVAGHGGLLLHQDSNFGFQMHTEGTATAAGSFMSMSLVQISDGAVQTPAIMRLNGNGNVGFGTATPITTPYNTNLTVSNAIAGRSAGIHIQGNVASGWIGGIDFLNSSNRAVSVQGFYDGGPTTYGLDIHTSNLGAANVAAIRIKGNGNVGIGTTTPSAKLDVSGTIRPIGAVLGSTCTPLGAQSYNSSTGAPMYCDGSVWMAVGGAVSASTIVTSSCVADSDGGICSTTTASCPVNYFRSGCSASVTSGHVFANAGVSGAGACRCIGRTVLSGWGATITCETHCVR